MLRESPRTCEEMFFFFVNGLSKANYNSGEKMLGRNDDYQNQRAGSKEGEDGEGGNRKLIFEESVCDGGGGGGGGGGEERRRANRWVKEERRGKVEEVVVVVVVVVAVM